MQSAVLNKLQEIADNKFDGKTIIKSKVSIFPDNPTPCIKDNMFFILSQKNKTIKVKSKHIEPFLKDFYLELSSVACEKNPILKASKFDELLEKHNFTYSKLYLSAALNAVLDGRIINNYIFRIDVFGNCTPKKKMWDSNINTSKTSSNVDNKIETFSKRNGLYVRFKENDNIKYEDLNKSKFKLEDGFIVCNYKNFLSLDMKNVLLEDNSITTFFKIIENNKEDYICKITKTVESKIANNLVIVEEIHIK